MNSWLESQYSLRGKTALVTGARTGIGREVAMTLARCGADVILGGRVEKDLADVAAEVTACGVVAQTVGVDMSDLDAVRRTATELACDRTVDILVNNAGIIRRAPLLKVTSEDWREVFSVNLDAIFELTLPLADSMIARGSGKIINVASLLSFQGGINVAAYAASKHALAGLTQAMSNEWAPRGLNVNAIAPGYVGTRNTHDIQADAHRYADVLSRIPVGRWGTPADIAGAVAFLSAPAASYVHGHVLVVDGGWMAR